MAKHFICALVAVSAWLCAGVAYADVQWLRAETAHFVLFSDVDLRTTQGEADALEHFDAGLRALTHVADDRDHNKLPVYFINSRQDLLRFFPTAASDVAGRYMAGSLNIAAYATNTRDDLGARQVLFHEYAHHFMFQYFAGLYPTWYIEGFAEYVQTAVFQDNVVQFGRFSSERVAWLAQATWLPINDMLTFQEGARSTATHDAQFYAQSWLMVHYFFDTNPRRLAVGNYLQAIRRGDDPITAFQPTIGVAPTEFNDSLMTYARHGITLQRVAVSPTPPAMITTMPPSTDDMAPLAVRMLNAMPTNARTPDVDSLASQIERTAAQYPSDALALRTLALARIYKGDYAQARATLASLILPDTHDDEAVFEDGLSHYLQAQDAAEIGAARRDFVRAFRINPHNAANLYFYAMTYSGGQPLTSQQLDTLLQADALAPQVAVIAVSAGRELMLAGRFDEAVNILGPWAYDPHASSFRDWAQALFRAAKAHQLPPAAPKDDGGEHAQ